eukprot:gb/GECG01010650.1/.p1 GENE.gb/GECG01010650.1/~~gb/GECG01010650.1/.p1  ORF type:complete len:213 (+),score=22.99 gb/GECG01010650.1/:1-639(+)
MDRAIAAQSSDSGGDENPRNPSAAGKRQAKDKVRRACQRCAIKKIKCDTGRPCRNCVSKGVGQECVDVETKPEKRRKLQQDRFQSAMSHPGQFQWDQVPSLVDLVILSGLPNRQSQSHSAECVRDERTVSATGELRNRSMGETRSEEVVDTAECLPPSDGNARIPPLIASHDDSLDRAAGSASPLDSVLAPLGNNGTGSSPLEDIHSDVDKE